MQWKTLATTALLTALSPVAVAEDEVEATWRCVPAADHAVTNLAAGSAVYYQKLYPNGGYYVEELWQETNGEAGLQSSLGMSCIGKADKLLRSVCVGFCPITM